MAALATTALESLDQHGNGLRVEFTKVGDRFAHSIFSVRKGEPSLLLASTEGTPDDFSPPSPPFAELHQQDEIVFLSGATTSGHWSASVSFDQTRLQFDVACRLKRSVDRLGSTYRINETAYELTPEADTTGERVGESLIVTPAVQAATSFPATMQWRYSITPKE